jgi:hypothetical protein
VLVMSYTKLVPFKVPWENSGSRSFRELFERPSYTPPPVVRKFWGRISRKHEKNDLLEIMTFGPILPVADP